MKTPEILHVNEELMIIYFSSGPLFCKSEEEFSSLIQQEKQKIKNRHYILNRFEHWEVTDHDSLRKILVSRSRDNNEKNLVLNYMKHLKGE